MHFIKNQCSMAATGDRLIGLIISAEWTREDGRCVN